MSLIKSNKRRTVIRPQHPHSANKSIVVGPESASAQTNETGHSIKLNRTGSQIDSIEVTCSCGERMVIRCDYE